VVGHLESRGGEDVLAARLKSYELAAKMQLSAPEAMDLSGESAETRRAYGIEERGTQDFGRRCWPIRSKRW